MSAQIEQPLERDERRASLEFGRALPPLREAHPDERRSVLEMLGRAFHDDPVAMHLFPEAASRSARWTRFSDLALQRMGSSALLWTSEDLHGAALWQGPVEPRLDRTARLGIMLRFLALMRSGTARAVRLDALTSPCRPHAPHYYLAALGTDPRERRRGIGSALIQRVLARADRERLPAYLESSKAGNVPFYEKHGFRVVTELRAPGGLRVWPMLRPAH